MIELEEHETRLKNRNGVLKDDQNDVNYQGDFRIFYQ